MFYYFIAPYLTYHFILIAAAIIPAVYLLIKVYRSDVVEKESPALLRRLVVAGIISTLIALVLERVFSNLLMIFVSPDSNLYRILLYFGVVGISEEGAKFFMLKKTSWNSFEFNYLYDGIVYATFTSLGFALWENISYVIHFGLANAFVRAFTAIPGHACFGVFMGVFYALSKYYDNLNDSQNAKTYSLLAVLVPVVLHGTYDYIASSQVESLSIIFIIFIVILFIVTGKIIRKTSQFDRYIGKE